MKLSDKIISNSAEWTFDLLKKYEKIIGAIAKNKFQLDTYPNQIEVISTEQMIELYATNGLPLIYNHWSFGREFLNIEKYYKRGHTEIAYELVINSNPTITYLMEENTMAMQALVIAHACYGHNSFFKGNYLFQLWNNSDYIIDYLVFAKNYITKCEEKYGQDPVTELIDSCHTIKEFGVDRYKRHLQRQANSKINTGPEENLLYFLEKNAPLLKPWQREIIRIIRKISQYFYPQRQTKVMNEGWATFWHYMLINELYNQNRITDNFYLEFLQNHTNAILQPDFGDTNYTGINPYNLGFKIFCDLKRICEHPTKEDKLWFKDIAGSNWLATINFAMQNFKDESFIKQYLSPKLIRDLKLFAILDENHHPNYIISAIHNQDGYQKIRTILSNQYDISIIDPNIQVDSVNLLGDRALILSHIMHDNQILDPASTKKILQHIYRIWGFKVILNSIDPKTSITKNTYSYPEN